ncbi:MAG: hypothetical protein INF88_18255 [Roseomonas sp.]|nr:hypothetical protein [Roseomonas sp.]
MPKQTRQPSPRFGIAEWFGRDILDLTPKERRDIALDLLRPKKERSERPCPFQARKQGAKCSKEGGVCSLRLYAPDQSAETGAVLAKPVEAPAGTLRVTCPYRFHHDLEILRWVGETILGDANPLIAAEVGFLEGGALLHGEEGDDVGRLDMILVKSGAVGSEALQWAALEIQAVYFSGDAMRGDFESMTDPHLPWLPFPKGRRRPDYRSSGPKRLMPQLQIKVPTLRRWGKKMAVVVDRPFFDSIGEMDRVADISNADIAWFIVGFENAGHGEIKRLIRDEVRFTTLERSVEGLTGGKPVPLSVFESRIKSKLLTSDPRSRRAAK